MSRLADTVGMPLLLSSLMPGAVAAPVEPDRAVLAIYMPGFLQRGPVWPTAIDRTRLPLTGDVAADRRMEMAAAKGAGIDAFLFDLFPTNRESNLAEYRQLFDAGREEDFAVVPIIDCNPGVAHTLADIVALCQSWFARFYKRPGLLTRKGLPLVIAYDANDQTPDTWRGLFADLEKQGYCAYWLAHLRGVMPQGDGSLAAEHAELVHDYLAAGFRGVADCGINVYPHQYGKLIRSYFEAGQGHAETVAVSPWPGYWRLEHAIYISPEGTGLLRGTWESVLAAEANLFDLFSWNDFSENHQVQPTLLWGRCRRDLTRHYTDRFRRRPPPVYPDPHVYITFRRSLVLGEKLNVELLRFPSSAGPATVTVEIKTVADVVLHRFAPVTLSGQDLEAETLTFPTSLAERERAVAVYTSSSVDRRPVASRFVDLVRIHPGFSVDFSTVSHLLSEMPPAPTLHTDSRGVAHVGASAKYVRLQLLRNADEVVWQSPPAPHPVPPVARGEQGESRLQRARLLFVLGSAPTVDRQPATWRGTLRVEGGKILRVNSADSMGRAAKELRISADSNVEFAMSCLGYTYPTGFFTDAVVSPYASWCLAAQGQEAAFTQAKLQAKSVLAWQWGANRALVFMVGGERDYGYVPVQGNSKAFEFDLADLPPDGPNDVYYVRGFAANGAWADSLPYVRRSSGEATVRMPYRDSATDELRETLVTAAEAQVAQYDFAEEPSDLFLVRDTSGRGLHAALPSGSWVFGGGAAADPMRVTEKLGPALRFDGEDDFVALPHCLMPTGALTVDLWVRPEAFDTERTVLADRRFGGGHGTLCLRLQPDGRLKVSRKGMNWVDMMSERPLRADEWQRVTATDDLRHVTLFLDGKPVGQMLSPGVGALPTFNLLGKEVDGSGYADSLGVQSRPFRGALARLRIYAAPVPPNESD